MFNEANSTFISYAELTNDDIADHAEDATGGGDEISKEKCEDGEGDVGAELMSMPSEVRASADSLLTTGTESPVIVSPPHSDDDGRTPKTSQGAFSRDTLSVG